MPDRARFAAGCARAFGAALLLLLLSVAAAMALPWALLLLSVLVVTVVAAALTGALAAATACDAFGEKMPAEMPLATDPTASRACLQALE